MNARLLNKIGKYYRQFRPPTSLKPFHDSQNDLPTLDNPVSQLCTENQFFSKDYNRWCLEIKQEPTLHRKQWEYVYILQVLSRNNMLSAGRRGLGFGVGKEPLPAVMANWGCSILISDQDSDKALEQGWIESKRGSTRLSDLNIRGISDPDLFSERVAYRTIDMNQIPSSLLRGGYDFIWSACALEHLGSIRQSVDFVINSLQCLKPGGAAVHTTEYNISSNWDTLDHSHTVFLRRRDIRDLQNLVQEMGCSMCFNPNYGHAESDLRFQKPPFIPSPHLKLMLSNYIFTSIGLTIERSAK